jgi:hypothetical protein
MEIFSSYDLQCYRNTDLAISLSNNNTQHRAVVILVCKIDYGCNPGASIPIKLGLIGEQQELILKEEKSRETKYLIMI